MQRVLTIARCKSEIKRNQRLRGVAQPENQISETMTSRESGEKNFSQPENQGSETMTIRGVKLCTTRKSGE